MRVKHWESYFPAFGEFATTFGVLAGLVLVYIFLVRTLPIHREDPLPQSAGEPDARRTAALPQTAEVMG